MKYIKRFESNNSEYAIVNPNGIKSEPTVPKIKELFHDFINNSVGLIIGEGDVFNYTVYSIGYNNVPFNLKRFFLFSGGYQMYYISVKEEKIIKKSKDKEELKAYINSKKYNI